MSTAAVVPPSPVPWWREINRNQWYALIAGKLGWMLDAFDVMLNSRCSGQFSFAEIASTRWRDAPERRATTANEGHSPTWGCCPTTMSSPHPGQLHFPINLPIQG